MNRDIFWKSPRTKDGESKKRFEREISLCSRLLHPHILSLLDHVSVGDVPRAIFQKGPDENLQDWRMAQQQQPSHRSPMRQHLLYLDIFMQLCRAVAYAHSLKILHCDIKPPNVLINPDAECFLIDWGAAEHQQDWAVPGIAEDATERKRRGHGSRSLPRVFTFSYGAPEQKEKRSLSPQTDIFALGGVLYFLLTGSEPGKLDGQSPPSTGTTPAFAAIPPQLSALIGSCRAHESHERPTSVNQVLDIIRDYIVRLNIKSNNTQKSRELKEDVERDYPVETLLENPERYLKATQKLHQAVELDEGNDEAKQLLATLYQRRHMHIEDNQNPGPEHWESAYLARLIEQLSPAHVEEYLNKPARLRLDGTQLTATLCSVSERDGRLTQDDKEQRSRLPHELTLQHGRYRLCVRRFEHVEALYPLKLSRGSSLSIVCAPPRQSELPTGCVWIPDGCYRLGGDAEAFVEPRDATLQGFAIGIFPVTCEEYLAFLNSQARHNASQAQQHAPKRPSGEPLWQFNRGKSQFVVDWTSASQQVQGPRHPIVQISALDAEAYCVWLSQEHNRPFRLPTADEWEAAARGMDRRYFPWGDTFQHGLCNSRPLKGKSLLLPVDECKLDCSPYGVRGMAGGVSDWTRSRLPKDGTIESPEDPSSDNTSEQPQEHIVKGGAWWLHPRQCRLARQVICAPGSWYESVGFRICMTLSKLNTAD